MNQYVILIGPLAGMMLGAIIRMIVDSRLKRILAICVKNPNPQELEANFTKIYVTPADRFNKMKANVQFRKGISRIHGNWYLGSLILHGTMFVCFVLVMFIVEKFITTACSLSLAPPAQSDANRCAGNIKVPLFAL